MFPAASVGELWGRLWIKPCFLPGTSCFNRPQMMSPSAYEQFRRWQRAMLSGSKPCTGDCGRTISMNAKFCRLCAEAVATPLPGEVASSPDQPLCGAVCKASEPEVALNNLRDGLPPSSLSIPDAGTEVSQSFRGEDKPQQERGLLPSGCTDIDMDRDPVPDMRAPGPRDSLNNLASDAVRPRGIPAQVLSSVSDVPRDTLQKHFDTEMFQAVAA